MSYYGNRTSTDRRTRTPQRKDSVDSTNTNGNNNNDVSKGLGSYISNYTRRTEYSQKTSLNRKPGAAPRMKSNLVGSMTATFEQLNKGSIPPPGNSSIKSSSYNHVENATTTDQKTTNPPKLENGTAANHTPRTTNAPKHENGTAKHDVDDEDAERTPAHAKSSSSARRGKQQREKRMLRQKRRSTGVVRLNESDDEAEKGTRKKGGNDTNGEKDDEGSQKSETENNTLSNEFSPPPSASSIRTESERTRTYEATDGTTSVLKSTLKSPTVLSLITSPQPSDNVFSSGDSTSRSPTTMPVLNSSRRRGNKSSYERSQQEANEKREIDELRGKLATAEITISKLSKEIEDLETDTQHLVEQNHDLKKQNKMLEDENSSMLMVLKQLRNSTV